LIAALRQESQATRDRNDSLRVLHIVASDGFAGTERHVLGLVSELRQLGCEAELACPRGASVLRREASTAGIPLLAILSTELSDLDIVHAHDGRSAVVGSVHATLGRAALVRTQHFIRPASAARPGWRGESSLLAHRLINRRLDGYVCVSEAAAEAAKERRDTNGAALVVIPSGVRLASAEHAEQARTERANAARPVVVTSGRLERERRIDILLDAIPLVRRGFPHCRFVIAGTGKAEGELQSHAQQLGIAGAIDWTGWLPEIAPVLAQGHVYVNTWPAEGFGMATAEAMGYALPVIVTDTGAGPELVEDRISGRVVSGLNPLALADAICELLGDPIRAAAMGAAARERASRQYSFRSTAVSTLEFYEHLPRIRREH
jgi:glycosyltransferase involved in cell wall biosynthesis